MKIRYKSFSASVEAEAAALWPNFATSKRNRSRNLFLSANTRSSMKRRRCDSSRPQSRKATRPPRPPRPRRNPRNVSIIPSSDFRRLASSLERPRRSDSISRCPSTEWKCRWTKRILRRKRKRNFPPLVFLRCLCLETFLFLSTDSC